MVWAPRRARPCSERPARRRCAARAAAKTLRRSNPVNRTNVRIPQSNTIQVQESHPLAHCLYIDASPSDCAAQSASSNTSPTYIHTGDIDPSTVPVPATSPPTADRNDRAVACRTVLAREVGVSDRVERRGGRRQRAAYRSPGGRLRDYRTPLSTRRGLYNSRAGR